MARDTEFVAWMCESGMTHRRAVAFEAWLSDVRPVGISPELLVKLVKRRADFNLASARAEASEDIAGQMRMFVDTAQPVE